MSVATTTGSQTCFLTDAAYAKGDVETIQLVVRMNEQHGGVEWPAALLRVK